MIDIHSLPADDVAAWRAYPRHRWIYCRVALSDALGIEAAPAGCDPPEGEVVWKPTMNLWGMGNGAFYANGPVPYRPGYMWQRRQSGRHISTDVLVSEGKVLWSAQSWGIPDGPERFSSWFLGREYPEELETVSAFVAKHLSDFSGAVNVETVGGVVIEAHLRLSQDWVNAGAYTDFTRPCDHWAGWPLWSPLNVRLPDWCVFVPDFDGPRFGFIAARMRP